MNKMYDKLRMKNIQKEDTILPLAWKDWVKSWKFPRWQRTSVALGGRRTNGVGLRSTGPFADLKLCLPSAWAHRADEKLCLPSAWVHRADEKLCLPSAWAHGADEKLCLPSASAHRADEKLCLPSAWAHRADEKLCLPSAWAHRADETREH
jgi:hypothetical protein